MLTLLCVPTPGRVPRGRRAGAGPMAMGSRCGHILLYQYRCGASTRVGRWGGCGPAWWGGAGCCQLGQSCSARLRVFPCPPAAAARAWAAPAGLGALGGVCFRVRSSPTAASGCCPFAAPQCVWLPPACPSPLPEQGNQQASALGMFLASLFGIKAQVGHDLKHQLKNMR